ncbi:MAG: hypothetical protein HC933_05570 [Pleurocapsa sp. SU_196_0]|nr:hypothetical protein [Pleurocapsa sp. SU_196_0]
MIASIWALGRSCWLRLGQRGSTSSRRSTRRRGGSWRSRCSALRWGVCSRVSCWAVSRFHGGALVKRWGRAAFDQAVMLTEAPEWIPLHPFGSFLGDFQGAAVIFTFDQDSLNTAQSQLKINPFVLDWHHSTVKQEAGATDRAPAAGFVNAFEVRDGFVYGRVEWNESGRESVVSGGYNFVSPVFYFDDSYHVNAYHSFALTNRPGTWAQRRIGLEASDSQWAQRAGGKMEELLKLLGLSADSTPEQMCVALEARLSDARFGEFVRKTLSLDSAALESTETRARVLRLVASEGSASQVAQLQAQLESERASRDSERVTNLVRVALEDGRILEGQREFWTTQAQRDFDAARVALEAMPKLVPQTLLNQAERGAQRAALEGDSARISALLGVTSDMLTKGDQ